MSGNGKSLGLKSYDDIFSTEEERQETRQERVVRLPLAELHYFKNHPFKVKDDEQMAETAESVKDYGVLVPGLVRPDPAGGYEIVSGHRRHRASQLAGVPDMPVIIREMDDDTAVEVSYLKPEEQGWLFEAMCRDECSPSLGQAQRLKKFSQDGKLTEDVISAILSEERPLETKLVFDKRDNLSNYFPKSFTARQQKEVIFKLLDTWAKNRQRQQGQER